MVALCSNVQKSHWLFCVESLDLGLDFKIRIRSIANQQKEGKILCIANKKNGSYYI